MKVLIAYVPVLHRGYFDLIYKGHFDEIHIMQEELVKEVGIDYLIRKDSIRALSSELVYAAIKSWGFDVHLLNVSQARRLKKVAQCFENVGIVLPNEDISRDFVDKYLFGTKVEFSSIFLRWHRDNTADEKQAQAHQTICLSDFEKQVVDEMFNEAERSFDWWRQVGAILVRDGEILLVAHNEHLPDEQAPYSWGDPRAVFKRGIHIELSISEHAEARIIAEAAYRGISTKGTDLFCTDFPCPPCAKLVARSGIRRLFFRRGYAVLDNEIILKNAGVELVYVE